jgi:perosamine synthetase
MQPFEGLEWEWAEFNGLDPAGMVACASGTAALHLALEALELPTGSEVIVPDFTMIACPRAVTMAGLRPVFVDCDDDLLMSQELLYQAVGMRTSAVMLVSVYGRHSHVWQRDTEGIKVIEDLAEAHGVHPYPKTDAACWSFYKNKIIHGEEGGAVWFRDIANAEKARCLRSLGFTAAHDFCHAPRGWNHRMSNTHAVLIRQSLWRYNRDMVLRQEIVRWHDEECPDAWRMPPRDVPWVYDLRLRGLCGEQQQYEVIRALLVKGIQGRHGFKPCSGQQEYMLDNWSKTGPLNPKALAASREVIYLPIQPGITTRESVREAFRVIKGIIGDGK